MNKHFKRHFIVPTTIFGTVATAGLVSAVVATTYLPKPNKQKETNKPISNKVEFELLNPKIGFKNPLTSYMSKPSTITSDDLQVYNLELYPELELLDMVLLPNDDTDTLKVDIYIRDTITDTQYKYTQSFRVYDSRTDREKWEKNIREFVSSHNLDLTNEYKRTLARQKGDDETLSSKVLIEEAKPNLVFTDRATNQVIKDLPYSEITNITNVEMVSDTTVKFISLTFKSKVSEDTYTYLADTNDINLTTFNVEEETPNGEENSVRELKDEDSGSVSEAQPLFSSRENNEVIRKPILSFDEASINKLKGVSFAYGKSNPTESMTFGNKTLYKHTYWTLIPHSNEDRENRMGLGRWTKDEITGSQTNGFYTTNISFIPMLFGDDLTDSGYHSFSHNQMSNPTIVIVGDDEESNDLKLINLKINNGEIYHYAAITENTYNKWINNEIGIILMWEAWDEDSSSSQFIEEAEE